MMKKIAAVLLAVILMTTLCSCGMTRKIAKVIANEIIEHREEKNGQQNTNSSAPKKGTAEYAVWEEIPEPKSPEQAVNAAEETGNTIAQLLSEMGSYRVIEKKSDRWVMEVTAPDMRKVFAHAQEKLDARGDLPIEEYDAALEQMLDDICNELRSGKVEYVTQQVTVQVSDGEPVLDAAFYDALYGGMLTVLTESYEAYAGGAMQ